LRNTNMNGVSKKSVERMIAVLYSRSNGSFWNINIGNKS